MTRRSPIEHAVAIALVILAIDAGAIRAHRLRRQLRKARKAVRS